METHTCHRHPSAAFTGFCPSCLHDRLQSLHIYNTDPTTSTHRNSTSIVIDNNAPKLSNSQLRRCKSTTSSFNLKHNNDNVEVLKSMKELLDMESKSSSSKNKSTFKAKISKWIRKFRGKDKKNITVLKKEEKEEGKVIESSFYNVEAGRVSVEYPRYSLDENLLCRPVMSRHFDKLVPVDEGGDVKRSDGDLIAMPGGSEQTKDYYLDTSSRSRRSLDVKKTKVCSPEFYRGWSVNSSRNGRFEGFELAAEKVLMRKKLKRWGVLGFMQRNSSNNSSSSGSRGGDGNVISNMVDRSFSNERMVRSNSSMSSRSSVYGSLNRIQNDTVERKRRDGLALESSRSGRYESPRHSDNGMLRFYLTPMRSRRMLEKARHSNVCPSYSKSVLQLY